MESAGNDQASDCIVCYPGKFSAPGSYFEHDCTPCEAGKFNYPPGTACTDCLAGLYVEVIGSDESADCIYCATGMYLDFSGGDEQADCIDCTVGRFVETTGSDSSSDCIACPAGRFANVVPGADGCIGCEIGRYIEATGSADAADCIQCGIGRYLPTTGSDQYSDCVRRPAIPPWTFASTLPPPSDSSTHGNALALQELCLPGFYEDERGQQGCKQCAYGSYTPRPGALACLTCCDGEQPAPNKTMCINCDPGHVSDGRICSPCRLNNYTRPGQKECDYCRPGWISNENHTDCDDIVSSQRHSPPRLHVAAIVLS